MTAPCLPERRSPDRSPAAGSPTDQDVSAPLPRLWPWATAAPLMCGLLLIAVELLARPGRTELVVQVVMAVGVGLGGLVAARTVAKRLRGTQAALAGEVARRAEVERELRMAAEEARGREDELHRRNDDLDAISRVTTAVLAGTDARRAVCEAAMEVTGAFAAVLLEPDPEGLLLRAAYVAGLDLPEITVPLGGGSRTASTFRSGRVQTVADVRADPEVDRGAIALFDAAAGGAVMRGAVYIPVMHEGRSRAVLAIALPVPLATTDVRLLGLLELLATDAALALTREALIRELAEQAVTDPLTGLANRRRWDEQLARELAVAARSGQPLTVALLDLDHFKRFNDSHGHPAGDALLVAAARSWSQRLRAGDLVARVGGEEFAVLLPGYRADQAGALVDRLLTGLPAQQTCSAGLAQWSGENAEQLVQRADRALYQAKQAGRARSHVSPLEPAGHLPVPRQSA